MSAVLLIPQVSDQNAFASGPIRDETGFLSNTLERNDDDSTECVNIGFDVDFFGAVVADVVFVGAVNMSSLC